MTRRRMQANDEAPRAHTVEHDELWDCDRHPPCEPVEEKKPMTSLTDAVNALPALDEGIYRPSVLALVKDKVAVPDTGTYVVADGVVHEGRQIASFKLPRGGRENTVLYTVEPPEPTFFEEGKTYATHWGARFEVDRAKDRVAFGFYTDRDNPQGQWTLMGHFPGWEEVR